jgi:hypothetical protein
MISIRLTIRATRGVVFAAAAIVASGCHSFRDPCCPNEHKGPKTLFEWAAKTKDEKPDESDKCKEIAEKNGPANSEAEKTNGNGESKPEGNSDENGGNGAPEPEKPIETDRPDFTEASSTVGRGRIQLEAGYTFISDRNSGLRSHSHSYPEALLRIGMFADWFELRLGQNFSNNRESSQGISSEFSGGEDLYIGCKLALTEQKQAWPETALILQMNVPTGHPDLRAGAVLPGLNYLFGWEVIEDCFDAGGSLQANRAEDDAGHLYVELAQSFTVGISFTERLKMYTEWFAFYPTSALSAAIGPEHYLNGGFTYLVTNNFQLDIRAGLGLNRAADDFFAGTGFAVRY